MKHSLLEWVFLDSLILSEIVAFGEHIKSNPDDLFGLSIYQKSHGNVERIGFEILKCRVRQLGLKIAIFIALPILVLWLVSEHFGSPQAAAVGAFSYATLAACWFAFKGTRWVYRRLAGYEGPAHSWQKRMQLWGKMCQVYPMLAGPVVNPTHLKMTLMEAHSMGARWDSAVYALLDRIIQRDAAVWTISEAYQYKD